MNLLRKTHYSGFLLEMLRGNEMSYTNICRAKQNASAVSCAKETILVLLEVTN